MPMICLHYSMFQINMLQRDITNLHDNPETGYCINYWVLSWFYFLSLHHLLSIKETFCRLIPNFGSRKKLFLFKKECHQCLALWYEYRRNNVSAEEVYHSGNLDRRGEGEANFIIQTDMGEPAISLEPQYLSL